MILAKGKSPAKTDGTGTSEAAGGIDWQAATGSTASQLQRHLLREVAETLWLPDRLSEEQELERVKSAIAMLEGIRPQSEIEGLLATQMVATHSAAMECLRRAMVDGQTFEGRDQNLKHAAKLLSIYARQVEVLDKHRGKGQQKVTVEYVNVESGGQAIVGQVETGKRKRRKGPEAAATDHAPAVPFETPAPAAPRKTRRKTPRKR